MTKTSLPTQHHQPPPPPVKTSLETVCFMVLNLETFDRLVFHGQYFTAVFKQALWHPCPRAAGPFLQKEQGHVESNRWHLLTLAHSRLKATSLLIRRGAFKALFQVLFSVITWSPCSQEKRFVVSRSDSCGFKSLQPFLGFLLCSTLEKEA